MILFDGTEMDKGWMKLARTSMTHMHGVNLFLDYPFANGNQGNKISWPYRNLWTMFIAKQEI